MFDIAFSELVVVALVALIVIGPERLPRVARTAGHLLGRLQRYVGDVKADISREMQLEELKKMQDDIVTQTRSLEQSVSEQLKTVETELNQSIAVGIEEKATATAEPAAATEATPAEPTAAEPTPTGATGETAVAAALPAETLAAPGEKPPV